MLSAISTILLLLMALLSLAVAYFNFTYDTLVEIDIFFIPLQIDSLNAALLGFFMPTLFLSYIYTTHYFKNKKSYSTYFIIISCIILTFLTQSSHFTLSIDKNITHFFIYAGAIFAFIMALFMQREQMMIKMLVFAILSHFGTLTMAIAMQEYFDALFFLYSSILAFITLFMGVGIIILVKKTQDIRMLHGLKKELPTLFYMMLFASLSLSAMIPFSGFFAQGAILSQLFASQHYLLYFVALITLLLITFALFKMLFSVFLGTSNHPQQKISIFLSIPLLIFTFATLCFGYFEHFSSWLILKNIHYPLKNITHYSLASLNTLLSVAIIFYIYKRYASQT